MSPIAANLQAIRRRISEALQGDSRDISIVAVAKGQSPEAIRAAICRLKCPLPEIHYAPGCFVHTLFEHCVKTENAAFALP